VYEGQEHVKSARIESIDFKDDTIEVAPGSVAAAAQEEAAAAAAEEEAGLREPEEAEVAAAKPRSWNPFGGRRLLGRKNKAGAPKVGLCTLNQVET
jgi:hypothetical protein